MAHAGIVQAIVILQPCKCFVLAARSIRQRTDTEHGVLLGGVHELQSRSVQQTARERVAQYQYGQLVANVLIGKELAVVRRIGCNGKGKSGLDIWH